MSENKNHTGLNINIRIINIAGLKISTLSYNELLAFTISQILCNEKAIVTYANANTVNLVYNNEALINLLNSFSLLHSDGVGIYGASKYLYRDKGLSLRLSGSDFYPLLAEEAIKNNWRVFFFGHDAATLNRIKDVYPSLEIAGLHKGYNFNDEDVIRNINDSSPDILIIGLGQPYQEKWIAQYAEQLNFKICYCVGDGIKVFAGNKTRGPKFMQTIGMEWLVRLLGNPLKYFKRYVIGNPLFLYRIIILKMRKFTQ